MFHNYHAIISRNSLLFSSVQLNYENCSLCSFNNEKLKVVSHYGFIFDFYSRFLLFGKIETAATYLWKKRKSSVQSIKSDPFPPGLSQYHIIATFLLSSIGLFPWIPRWSSRGSW